MKIASRYIAKTVITAIAIVLLVLIGLELFILIVSQMGRIGTGNYGVLQAFMYAGLMMPYQVYLFFPVACLIGSLIGLGTLAANSELLVMRAAGASILQITWAVLSVTLVLIIVVTFLGEMIVPKLVHYADDLRAIATSGGQALRTTQGLWLRDGNRYIHIHDVQNPRHLLGFSQYQFNQQHQLVTSRYAASATYQDHRWQLHDIAQSTFTGQKVSSQHERVQTWNTDLKPQFFSIASIAAEEMNLWQLHHYIQEQLSNHLQVRSYQLAYWQRIFQPLSSCIMLILAIPFIFGSLRNSTMGSKIVLGVTFGFGFHTLNEFFGPMSLVYQFPPLLAALLPTLVFAVVAVVLLRRVL